MIRRLREYLLCRVGRHAWNEPFLLIGRQSYSLTCDRCDHESIVKLPWHPSFRQPASSSFLDRLSQPAIERAESRAAWAPATVTDTSPSQKARDTESASVATPGAGR